MTQSYHQAVKAFAQREGLEIYRFKKKEDKEKVANADEIQALIDAALISPAV